VREDDTVGWWKLTGHVARITEKREFVHA